MNASTFKPNGKDSDVLTMEIVELSLKAELLPEDFLFEYIRQAEMAIASGSANHEAYEIFVLCQAELAKCARGR